MTFFDVHTHKIYKRTNVISIISAPWINDDNFYSAGIHPWYINNDHIEKINLLDAIADRPNILAIGEIGLDKACKTNFELQEKVFIEQLSVAQKHNKSVILHCVRAFDEVLHLTKEIKTPLVMHGFNKGCELAKQFIDRNFYLSFGKSIFDKTSKSIKTLEKIPLHRLFLETDESDFSILEIYKRASEIKGININDLIVGIEQNFREVFKYHEL